ncbi:MAG: efflux transporter outer membrane subunit [bacterium]
MRRALFALALPSLLLTGCATPPPEPLRAPPLMPLTQTSVTDTVSRPLPAAWWTAFCDPELDRLVEQARQENRDLWQAAARLEAAQAQARIIGAESALHVTGAAGAGRQRSSENTGIPLAKTLQNQFSTGLQFAYEVDLWGRIRASREAARKEVELTAAERAAAEITVLAEVAKQHLSRLAARREAAVLEKQIAGFADTETLQAARTEAGFASELDLQRVRVEKATREVELSQLREREQALANALAQLCGHGPESTATNPVPSAAVTPEFPSALSLALLEGRPDVAAKRASWEAAFQRVQAARADFYPTLRLSGTLGYEAAHAQDLLDWQSRLWSLVAGLTTPVLDGGRLKGTLARERAILREAAAAYEAAVLTTCREVADALNLLHSAAEQQAAAERACSASQRALALSRERYEKGFVTYLEVVESDRSLLASQRTLIQLQARRQTATVDLIRALGLP